MTVRNVNNKMQYGMDLRLVKRKWQMTVFIIIPIIPETNEIGNLTVLSIVSIQLIQFF